VTHPGGYGREIYFWSFVVALLVFALGAGVSVYEGIDHLRRPEAATSPAVAYGVLALAFLLEGGSTLSAFREVSRSRRGRSWWQTLTASKDPSILIVLLENGAAMAGIVIAVLGLTLAQWTGNPSFDGVASILIGLLLGFVAVFLAREAKGLLIGEAADPELIVAVRRAITQPGIMGIGEIMTLHNSPDQIVVAANVDFDNRLSAADVEQMVSAIEGSLQSLFPSIHRVYIRPHENAGVKFGADRGLIGESNPRSGPVER
jgi:cation diffusion facilitator family transporter